MAANAQLEVVHTPPAAEVAGLSGAEIFVRSLLHEGVDTIFGYPGGAVLGVYDRLFHAHDLRHILVRHEQGGTHAADGYARASGKPGVVLATSGPAQPTRSPASPRPTWTAFRWWCSPGRCPPR